MVGTVVPNQPHAVCQEALRIAFRWKRLNCPSSVRSRGQRQCKAQAQAQDWVAPWAITFDLRERETEWTFENQERLLLLLASERLDVDIIEVRQRLAQLTMIVPNLRGRVRTMQPALLAKLLRDPPIIASRLVNLKAALPAMDIAKLGALSPQILLQQEQRVIQSIASLAELLGIPSEAAQNMVSDHPRFLDTELVQEVLAEMKRLMPGRDVSALLQAQPTWLLRVEYGTKRLGPHPEDI